MIPQKQIEQLKSIGIDLAALVAAHADANEVTVTLPEGQFLTDTQITELYASKTKEGEGKAFEIAKKELAKVGLPFTAERWGDVANEIKSQINATNDDKIKSLMEQNTLLSQDVSKFKADAETERNNRKAFEFETKIVTSIPKPENGLTQKEVLEIAKIRGYSPKELESGEIVWEKDGQTIKDKVTHAPLTNDKGIFEVVAQLGFAPSVTNPPAGRGIPQGKTDKSIKSLSEAKAKFKEMHPDKNVMGTEFQAFVSETAKADPSFDFSS
jgi:hypothetical protein